MSELFPIVTPDDYTATLQAGQFYFYSPREIYKMAGESDPLIESAYRIKIFEGSTSNAPLFSGEYGFDNGKEYGEDKGFSTNLENGKIYIACYGWSTGEYVKYAIEYKFQAVENYYPLKQWTITDVINRLLDLAEPLRQGERPRFILQGIDPDTGDIQPNTQAARFDKILAPQFSFTKQTLRECLKEIGGVVHGEPRLDIAQDSDGNYYYEVSFDLYGQTDRAGIYAKPYIQKTVSQVIDSYASSLDSNAENLVNQLDKLAGVIVEPYEGGNKSVRTETMYARITDANMLIQTQYPINTVEEIWCLYGSGSSGSSVNITPYVFESSIYNARLSSYDGLYPYSKAYGITYTQGQKNITALNFKEENPVSDVFENYAIINILSMATGKDVSSFLENFDYPLLAFRVTYTPFYNSRVGQTKVNYQDYPRAAALIYNQQSNVIESRYYGENLKGVIARLGNVDKSITYNLARLSDIPKAGQLYSEDYYISTVAVEFLPTYIKCTIGLSKDFNRLSQYIGVSSVKRYSEVSQGQAFERNTLWKEYVVIGDEEEADDDCYIGEMFMQTVANTFTQSGDSFLPLTLAIAWGKSYDTEETDISSTVTISSIPITNTTRFTFSNPNGERAEICGTLTEEVDGTDVTYDYAFSTNNDDFNVDALKSAILPPGKDFTVTKAVTYPSLPAVNLPVISSAFGNSIAFSWAYEDNYSAGAISQYAESGGDSTLVTGYFQNNYQYTDYYGRLYYYNFDLQPRGNIYLNNQYRTGLPQDTSQDSYGVFVSTIGKNPIALRKDNREALQCNFQVDFVSNRKGLIVGSALASYCPLVRGDDSSLAAKLYIFNEPLDKFIYHVESSLDVDLDDLTAYDITVSAAANGRFTVSAANFPVSGKAWAIVTAQSLGDSYMVENEQGEPFPMQDVKGGDVLIAQNMDFSAGDAFPTVYFTKKREVFNKNVWIANR